MTALERVLRSAAEHPWYRRPALGRQATAGGSLEDWPVLEKADLYERLAGAPGGEFPKGVYLSRSGGTGNGRPLYFPADIEKTMSSACYSRGDWARQGYSLLTPSP